MGFEFKVLFRGRKKILGEVVLVSFQSPTTIEDIA